MLHSSGLLYQCFINTISNDNLPNLSDISKSKSLSMLVCHIRSFLMQYMWEENSVYMLGPYLWPWSCYSPTTKNSLLVRINNVLLTEAIKKQNRIKSIMISCCSLCIHKHKHGIVMCSSIFNRPFHAMRVGDSKAGRLVPPSSPSLLGRVKHERVSVRWLTVLPHTHTHTHTHTLSLYTALNSRLHPLSPTHTHNYNNGRCLLIYREELVEIIFELEHSDCYLTVSMVLYVGMCLVRERKRERQTDRQRKQQENIRERLTNMHKKHLPRQMNKQKHNNRAQKGHSGREWQ